MVRLLSDMGQLYSNLRDLQHHGGLCHRLQLRLPGSAAGVDGG